MDSLSAWRFNPKRSHQENFDWNANIHLIDNKLQSVCTIVLYSTVCNSISIDYKQFVLPLSDKLFVSVVKLFCTNSLYQYKHCVQTVRTTYVWQTVCFSCTIVFYKQFILPLSHKLFVSVYQFLTNSSYVLGPKTVCISIKIQVNLSKYSVSNQSQGIPFLFQTIPLELDDLMNLF